MTDEPETETPDEAPKVNPWKPTMPTKPGFYRCWWTDGDGYDVAYVAENGWIYFTRHCPDPFTPEDDTSDLLWDPEPIEFIGSPNAIDAEIRDAAAAAAAPETDDGGE